MLVITLGHDACSASAAGGAAWKAVRLPEWRRVEAGRVFPVHAVCVRGADRAQLTRLRAPVWLQNVLEARGLS